MKIKTTEKKEEHQPAPKKHRKASQGDSSRTQKGDPAQKAKGKQEGRK